MGHPTEVSINDFQRYVAEEYVEQYQAGQMSRRGMLRRIGLITGGAAMAVGFLKELGIEATADEVLAAGPEAAPAAQRSAITVSPEDPAIRAGWIVFSAEDGAAIIGYLARPSAPGAHQGLVVVHETRGPTEHFLDVTRRFARDGFTALAPDLLLRAGGVGAFNDPAQISATLTAATPERNTSDLSAGVAALVARDDVRPGGVGVVGYCFGGGLAWRLAVTDPNVVAAAPYYGPAPPLESVPNIRGPGPGDLCGARRAGQRDLAAAPGGARLGRARPTSSPSILAPDTPSTTTPARTTTRAPPATPTRAPSPGSASTFPRRSCNGAGAAAGSVPSGTDPITC